MRQSIDKKNKIVIYLIFLLILSTTNNKFSKKQGIFFFKIDKIEVIGLSNDMNLKIQNELSNIIYHNTLLLGRKDIKKIIHKYNIIQKYNIQKIYPSKLKVDIKPTKFIAKVTKKNSKLLVGANGKLIPDEQNNIILPYIFGEFNSKNFLEFKKIIEHSKFKFFEFKTIYFFPSNRWDILTTKNILIKLPQSNMLPSLNLAYKIINDKKFLDKNIIDLRVNNNLIIK